MDEEFKWTNAAYHTMSKAAINQLLALKKYDGEIYNLELKRNADNDRRTAEGKPSRTTGKLSGIETYITAFEEQGWTMRVTNQNGEQIFKLTDAGNQAIQLINNVPGHLKFLPYFISEILMRYKINNPSQSRRKDANLDTFPFWILYKVMHLCDGCISEDEFRRFLVKIERTDEVNSVINTIKSYRVDLKEENLDSDELNKKYGICIEDTKARPLYFMHKAGEGLSNIEGYDTEDSIIYKDGTKCKLGTPYYKLNPIYYKFIETLLETVPTKDVTDMNKEQWFEYYGGSVSDDKKNIKEHSHEVEKSLLPENHNLVQEAKYLVENGTAGIILSGPPGTGKTWNAKQIALHLTNNSKSNLTMVQFHPGYGYEEFVEGFVPHIENGINTFKVKKKFFAQLCDKARNSQDLYVLIIDEFNRGDISKILGESLTYLESDYRDTEFYLPYSESKFSIPKNLVIIGTMNPFDKSVAEFDIAMTRRFDIIPISPDVEVLGSILDRNEMSPSLKDEVIEFFKYIQDVFTIGLGHAFFKNAKNEEDLKRIWKYKLSPLFENEFRYEPDTLENIKSMYKWSS